MSKSEIQSTSTNQIERKPLRLWPGIVIVVVQWLLKVVVPKIEPEAIESCVRGRANRDGLSALVVSHDRARLAAWCDRSLDLADRMVAPQGESHAARGD